jgi:hypothetical protein
LGSLVAFGAGVVAADDRASDALAKKLAEFPGAEQGTVSAVMEPSLGAAFPNYRFYVLRFRQYPVARVPSGSLQANNLFVVKPDASVDGFQTPRLSRGSSVWRSVRSPRRARRETWPRPGCG